MTEPTITHDDLLLYACDDLDAERQAMIRNAVDHNPDLRKELDVLLAGLGAVGPGANVPDDASGEPRLSARFDASLQAKLDAEWRATGADAAESEGPPRHRRSVLARLASPLVGAAAAVLLLALIGNLPTGSPNLGGSNGVAWADVLEAVGQVDYCHTVAFADEPGNVDRPALFKIELFYRDPDMWRAQGFEQVHFLSKGQRKVYDAKQRKFVEPEQSGYRLIPEGFVEAVEQGDFLDGVLTTMFHGEMPKGEPVKSAEAMSGGGIEVFDYARDPKYQWARIWVLKESRLPIRIKVYQPRSDDFMLVTFDYTDPQPKRYFDPAHFEKEIKDNRLTKPHEILRAGSEPIADKPTDPPQIYPMQGIKAPNILATHGLADGAFLLVTDHPDNVGPKGYSIENNYWGSPTDNWGNRYVRTSSIWGITGRPDTKYDSTFVPAPPFKRGVEPRIVRLRYAVSNHNLFPGQELSYQVLADVQRPIGFDGADHMDPARRGFKVDDRQRALESYRDINRTAYERFQVLEQKLDAEPESLGHLMRMHGLLRKHGPADRAELLFEQMILPVVLEDPFTDFIATEGLGRYLISLHEKGKRAKLNGMVKSIEAKRQEALELPKRDRRRSRAEASISRQSYSVIGRALEIPAALERFKTAPKPTIQSVQRSRDGFVLYSVRLPEYQVDGRRDASINKWGIGRATIDGRQENITNHYDSKTETQWRVSRGTGNHLRITWQPAIVGRQGDHLCVKHTWTTVLDIPAEPSIDDMQQWWIERYDPKSWPKPSAVQNFWQMKQQASQLLNDGRHVEAQKMYEEVLRLPQDQWPEHVFHPANAGLDLEQRLRDECWANIRICRLRQGQIDEVLGEIARMEADLKPLEGPIPDSGEVERHAYVRTARIQVVRALMDRKEYDRAQTILDEIAKKRPDIHKFARIYVARRISKTRSTGGSPRASVRNSWRPFDTVQWDLIEARQ
jgi:tetratricopeptide (TPR) repeat protein